MQEKRRIKRQCKFNRNIMRLQIIEFVIHIVLIIALGLVIIGNQNSMLVMQADTLNTIANQSVNTDAKSLSEVKPEALTSEERELICKVVAAEARGEGLQGQMAVAQIIKDRSELWSMTVTEVLTAEGQFATPYEGEISDSVYLAVANVFDGGMRVFEEPVTHFAEGKPWWADSKIERGTLGRHTFYY
jgi:hypothetical protein